ncbi:hypothetical protein C0995_015125 [Termitomyces sp. Mi166|nr:hypothetical protein C0995_015125 [Termitomyces sp. Mi166\
MYSDDDLQDEDHALFHTWNPRPEICAFEMDEEETRLSFATQLREKPPKDEVDPAEVTRAIEWIRMWRIKRFFKVVQGFYMVRFRVLAAQSRRIILKRPLSFYIDLNNSDLSLGEYIATAALNARKDTLAFCDFLENRRELLGHMESLVVADQWIDTSDQTILRDHPISQLDGGKFYTPFYKSLQRIISSSVNLTILTFSEMKLDLYLIACICDLPKLDCLNLRMCSINKQARRALTLDTSQVLVSAVRYLEIVVTNETSIWYAMLFCPKLHNFSVRGFSGAVFPPPEAIWDKCRFFKTLKCLYLGRLAFFHLQMFVEWIQQHGDTPYLTHLKIEAERWGITDASIISFLRAVQGAPLEVLSIEGALQASLHLFDWIALHFPRLLGLTIMRHSSTRSRRTNLIVWPLPVWQYAQRFSAFSRLQYFGWNNGTFSTAYSTYSLRFLEEGYLDDVDNVGRGKGDENEWFSPEDEWLPKLFAIHCSTLRTLSLTFMFITYRILRPSEGVIKIENELGRDPIYSEQWNPSPLFGHWPLATRQIEDEI